MALTDKTLLAIERNPLNTENARAMARELLAARKVVRAASKLMRCDSFESDEWFGSEAGLMATLDAYDKARESVDVNAPHEPSETLVTSTPGVTSGVTLRSGSAVAHG